MSAMSASPEPGWRSRCSLHWEPVGPPAPAALAQVPPMLPVPAFVRSSAPVLVLAMGLAAVLAAWARQRREPTDRWQHPAPFQFDNG